MTEEEIVRLGVLRAKANVLACLDEQLEEDEFEELMCLLEKSWRDYGGEEES